MANHDLKSVGFNQKRCGFVALIGPPNAGKSTLTNQLVGTKISIVTHKVQTTRARIRGIYIDGAAQVILIDTPGIFTPKKRLDRAMVDAAWGGALDADLVVLLIDCKQGLNEDARAICKKLKDLKQPVVLALNKVDLVEKLQLLTLAQQLTELYQFEEVFFISAETGDGVDELKAHLSGKAITGPWHYPDDQITDAPMRHTAAEITREKLFLRLHEEIPYASTVETTSWKRLKKGIRIEQTIFVERDSQKKIVLGKNGQSIKTISIAAREEMAEVFEAPVHLFLFVKVRARWGEDPERYQEMGLDYTK